MQIAIVLYPEFTALDFIGPYEVLRGLPGAQVRFVWKETGPITADSGALVVGATHTFDETPEPDLVLVPGGPGCAAAAGDDDVLTWLRRVSPNSSWTASVCSGSLVLGAAGLLEGKRATTHWAVLPALGEYGAVPVGDERIVHEGKVVTAAGVSAGIDLALWLVGRIAGDAHAELTQLVIEYDPQPPYDSGHTSKASRATMAAAAALMGSAPLPPERLAAGTRPQWDQAIAEARGH
jgi:transcriptional regulator GlxA family with amidase domain